MNIVGIEGLVFGVTDLPLCERYLRDWGFEPADYGIGNRLRVGDGTWIELHRHDDASLAPLNHASPGFDGSCVRQVVWGVDTAATLAQIAKELDRDRIVWTDAQGMLHAQDPAGNSIAFAETRRSPVRSAPKQVNVPGTPARIDRPAEGASKAMPAPPVRLNHFVYMAPDAQAARTLARFYIDRLGFRLSDALGERGAFLRPAASSDHHSVLIECFGEGNRGVQHVAIEYRDFDHLMHRGTFLETQGWESHVGPGRHTLGSNCTWYFFSPLGGLMELVSDMDQITDDWQPRSVDPAKAGPPWAWLARPFPPGFRFGVGPRKG